MNTGAYDDFEEEEERLDDASDVDNPVKDMLANAITGVLEELAYHVLEAEDKQQRAWLTGVHNLAHDYGHEKVSAGLRAVCNCLLATRGDQPMVFKPFVSHVVTTV